LQNAGFNSNWCAQLNTLPWPPQPVPVIWLQVASSPGSFGMVRNSNQCLNLTPDMVVHLLLQSLLSSQQWKCSWTKLDTLWISCNIALFR
jgi:hypothetical protein